VAMALVIGLLIGAGVTYALAGQYGSRSTTVTMTTTTLSDFTQTNTITVMINSTQQVMSAYTAHLQSIGSESLTALDAEYESNATLALTGSAGGGLGGRYESAASIGTFYQMMFSSIGFPTMNIANESYAVDVSGNGKEAIVNSNFTIYGNDTGFSYMIEPSGITVYRADIRTAVSYIHLGNTWFISNETLDFLTFEICGTTVRAAHC
jgi:hypothetical protein